MIRSIFVFLHRWVGMSMMGFLVLVGLTGSFLAFDDEIERFVAPRLYATPRPGAPRLDLATLAEKVELLTPPHTRFVNVQMNAPDRAVANFMPDMPETLKDLQPGKVGLLTLLTLQLQLPAATQIFIDPWTGNELGRRRYGVLSEGLVNLTPFIFQLHWTLAPIAPFGIQILGVVAVLWTIDCFVGFYLTLPVSVSGFWRKWKTAWTIKRGASDYRLNFDLHRANGLWLWPALFIFAWSGVLFNMKSVYQPVMKTLFDFHPSTEMRSAMKSRSPKPHPSLDWRAAQAVGEKLLAEQAAKHGFAVIEPISLGYFETLGLYNYAVRSSRAVSSRGHDAKIQFDGDTGEFFSFEAPSGEHRGDTITSWLKALHTASVFGLPYKIFVCALGLVIVMLSATGVYIWWKKRNARRFHKERDASTASALEATVAD
ncbi:PepSY-associated TM helix domain-containing protein [Methylosinus sp. LW4]|uniref:PepSY-associated TM helix domain-containing protein n=1 Tax=Methylosinus sp. LW4 TaxID=136993 RepID=UPI000365AEF5|nr:PepSY-associated TM helix domain-containing protein [Methylosinus sp. LW4]